MIRGVARKIPQPPDEAGFPEPGPVLLPETDEPIQQVRSVHRGAAVLWLTGLSGAGKTTLAQALEQQLLRRGVRTFRIDGDALRQGLCRDLGFSLAERAENIRRAAELARLACSQGLIAICSLISPLAEQREAARRLFRPGEFLEVHLNCPLEVCQQRDPKGLYARAQRGEIPEFTGLSSPYEAPQNPELVLDTSRLSLEEAVARLMELLRSRGLLPQYAPPRMGLPSSV
jgi:adenylylsulfate kinase